MRKKAVEFVVAGVLVLGLFSGSAGAALNFAGLVGWYSPNFGEINDYFDDVNDFWDTDLGFEGGMAYGAGVEYEITPNFKLRGEWAGFTIDTSDSVSHPRPFYRGEFELTMNAYTLSGIYRMSPEELLSPYIGAGLGQFKTNLEWEESGVLPSYIWITFDRETEESIGFQALMGIEFDTEKFLLRGEARYISAEVEIEDFSGMYDDVVSGTKVDLGGLFLNVGAIIRF